jgi:2-polyprenyl-3-methyl-5-hydroxy-6-metoxy-1,4-benzoquinol methylase
VARVTTWDGDEYQKRFDDLAASGVDVHGEVAFVMRYSPNSVLDAGCGSGRVAIELARRGVATVVGADVNNSMLDVARGRAPGLTWVESDLAALDLGRRFDVVVMAGNVPIFTPPGTHAALVAGCARHVATGSGVLVAASNSAAATNSTSTTRTAPPPASSYASASPPGRARRSRATTATPFPSTQITDRSVSMMRREGASIWPCRTASNS